MLWVVLSHFEFDRYMKGFGKSLQAFSPSPHRVPSWSVCNVHYPLIIACLYTLTKAYTGAGVSKLESPGCLEHASSDSRFDILKYIFRRLQHWAMINGPRQSQGLVEYGLFTEMV